MFNKENNSTSVSTGTTTTKHDTLLGKSTKINGDISFNGTLHLDGCINGSIISGQADDILRVSESGTIEGKVEVANIIINGKVKGDITASGKIEVLAKASIEGNVFYTNIEMETGSKINGQLIYQDDKKPKNISKIDDKKAK